MYLNYFNSMKKILSDLVINVVYWTIRVVGSNLKSLDTIFFLSN